MRAGRKHKSLLPEEHKKQRYCLPQLFYWLLLMAAEARWATAWTQWDDCWWELGRMCNSSQATAWKCLIWREGRKLGMTLLVPSHRFSNASDANSPSHKVCDVWITSSHGSANPNCFYFSSFTSLLAKKPNLKCGIFFTLCGYISHEWLNKKAKWPVATQNFSTERMLRGRRVESGGDAMRCRGWEVYRWGKWALGHNLGRKGFI